MLGLFLSVFYGLGTFGMHGHKSIEAGRVPFTCNQNTAYILCQWTPKNAYVRNAAVDHNPVVAAVKGPDLVVVNVQPDIDDIRKFWGEKEILAESSGHDVGFVSKDQTRVIEGEWKFRLVQNLNLNLHLLSFLIKSNLPVSQIDPLNVGHFLQANAVSRNLNGFTGRARLSSDEIQGGNAEDAEPPLRASVPVWRLIVGGLCVWCGCLVAYKRDGWRAGILAFALLGGGTAIFLMGISYS